MPQMDADDEVVARLQALATIQPIDVYYVDEAPNDDQLPTQNGMVIPFVTVHPGTSQSSYTGRGIISNRKDPVEASTIVEITAPNTAIVRQLDKAIVDELMGLKFPGTSDLTPGMAAQGRLHSEDRPSPTVYKAARSYTYFCNLASE